jgi:flavodoxin
MQSIVIYDSLFGNTEKIARVIYNGLAPHGLSRLVMAGEINLGELTAETLVVLGSPTQNRGLSPAMQALVDTAPAHALAGRAVVVFGTRLNQPRLRTGSAAQSLAGETRKLGGRMLVPAEDFLVQGDQGPLALDELRRAAEWVPLILAAFDALKP